MFNREMISPVQLAGTQTITVRSPCGMLMSVLVSDVENSAIFSSVDVGNENFKDGVGPSFRRSREVGRN